jgi:hypothetical protein
MVLQDAADCLFERGRLTFRPRPGEGFLAQRALECFDALRVGRTPGGGQRNRQRGTHRVGRSEQPNRLAGFFL